MAEKWTTAGMPDQTGKLAVVTGANGGLGLITTRELARSGARVVLASRDVSKGHTAAEGIRAAVPDAQVQVEELDLASLDSVRAFAARMKDAHDHVDVLVNNAGIMATPKRTTADGFELQFGTNHLGHFALTGLLLDRLLAAPEPRVVTVTSTLHVLGRLHFDNLQSERRYNRWLAYGRSKLANLLFSFELDRRARAAWLPLRSIAAHPGYARTNLQIARLRFAPAKLAWSSVNRLFAQNPEVGALATLYAATVPDVEGGAFVGPKRLMGHRGHPGVGRATARAYDEESARRLWEASEELTGVRYEFERAPVTV